MDLLLSSIADAFRLLFSGDAEVWRIVAISFSVSTTAILAAVPPALAIAFVLAYASFPGRRLLISLFNTFLYIPAVVIGLTLFILLSRQGPLGDFRLLFTQTAMVMGQFLLALPILVCMLHTALQSGNRAAWETARTLGAGSLRAVVTVLHEIRFGLLAAIVTAYGRIISEVGASMMLGGNIAEYTRNIPTAIALETSRGAFAEGIALGSVLLLLAFLLNLLLQYAQGKGSIHP
ncbi:MAG: ABC transporter permease [Gammaproteobacteria bacterium]|nr:ABC transporter permease [Gammaproteobacteria bacterium]